ncbi:MAG TPA: BLUF domain-containing protein [Streptosporangiaceae bacterium]
MGEVAANPSTGTSGPGGSGPGSLFRLMYRSRNKIPGGQRKAELGTLFSAARSNNKKQSITGALLIYGDWFAQVLEGAEAPVRALFATIEQDPRHENISVIQSGPAGDRVFSRWAMARVSADGEPDIRLIAHPDGIAPAMSRGTTPEQEALLDVMRAATRGDAHAH